MWSQNFREGKSDEILEDGYGNKVELVFGSNLGDIKKKGGAGVKG